MGTVKFEYLQQPEQKYQKELSPMTSSVVAGASDLSISLRPEACTSFTVLYILFYSAITAVCWPPCTVRDQASCSNSPIRYHTSS